MNISPEAVKNLRQKTGVGMMDCKKALLETGGDEEKAIEYLRKRGLAKVAKRSGREAREGLIVAYIPDKRKYGILVELNCETDFVAKTDEFQTLAHDIAQHLATKKPVASDVVMWEDSPLKVSDETVKNLITSAASKLGENILLRRFCLFDLESNPDQAQKGIIGDYIHTGSKLGVMVELNCNTDSVANSDEFKSLARDIALHVTAANPMAVSREDIPSEVVEKEKEIFLGQIESSGQKKPPNVIEKIVTGKLDKFYSEVCLLEQPYVKDPDETIADLVAETAAKLGENIVLRRFCRLKVGE